ncbi:alpha/beta hydrolase [Nocardia sp. CA-135398]|uniref:alpha/beta hydrolase n=1 Tax=Nocardia sp. CA-135398 TaxID=3239977 RepID=UPI003D99DD28
MSFHPDLRTARFLPRSFLTGPATLRLTRWATAAAMLRAGGEVIAIPNEPAVSVRFYRPQLVSAPAPALLWIHGGGFVTGNAGTDNDFCTEVSNELGAIVAAVEYRRAPEHPFPTPLDDCYSALRWLAEQSDVDRERIAIGGASGGGGLAAALGLLARDKGEIQPAFQLLVYPMLDDRTALRTDIDERRFRLWNQRSNRFGWQSYLGAVYGTDEVPMLAAAARCEDLSGLPPTWIGVGDHDLFLDENVAYAQRLQQTGIQCTLDVVPGAYHGFDVIAPKTPVSRSFIEAQINALRGALTRTTTPE